MPDEIILGKRGGIRDWPIEDELKNSYLTYSMSVIVSRALPEVRDGLKPVQRRILTALRDLNLTHSSKYRKCAKVVGETMGNYHPHGDQAIYDTLVRMAQDFSCRYPLVDGQGNFGSIDGDPPAAQRYTECRMQRLCDEILTDLDKDTIDFVDNYDGSAKEPSVMPAKAPLLLLNGATGIAVGMATSIPPHNLKEVCQAIIALLDDPDMSIKDLMKHIKGPDFPTGGQICGRSGIRRAYNTGRGTITMRGRYHVETDKRDRQKIVITEIPYQVNKKSVVERIAAIAKEGRIRGIANLEDYSNKNGIRVCIELKAGEDANIVVNQLYKLTPLQSNFSVMNIALVRGRPETLNLKQMLECYRDHRFEVIRRRTLFLLNKAKARAHVLEGLLKAIDEIDRVVAIIRAAADVPTARAELMQALDLTETQAQAILDMRLSRLTGLQRRELEEEYQDLQQKIEDYTAILSDPALVMDIIREDCYELIDRYADDRRTEIVGEAEEISVEDLIAEEEMAVVLSHQGYIKRMELVAYRRQGRGGKGVTGMGMKDEDFIEHLFIGSTLDYMLFFTNLGQVHWLKVYDVPQMGRTARGRSIANLLELRKQEFVTAMVPVRTFDEEHFLVLATRGGVIKKTVLQAFGRPMKGGIRSINLQSGDELMGVMMTSGDQELMLASRQGQACRFHEKDVRSMGRAARGVAGMKLGKDDQCVGLMSVQPDCAVLTVSERGFGKRSRFEDYRLTRRGAKGVVNLKITEKNGPVVSCMTVLEDDEVMLMTAGGMVVRTAVSEISVKGRATQGVRMIRVGEGDKVVAVARLAVKEENGGGDEAAEARADQEPGGGHEDAGATRKGGGEEDVAAEERGDSGSDSTAEPSE